ncbi:MAG: CopD family protein [Microthrixaceae bacterium]|nr:CopD family protein [Microthrixaceae bacterium]
MNSLFMQTLMSYLHIIGVAVYLGGSIIMEFVVGPAQKAIPPAQAQVMGKKTADRFLIFVWSALGLILLSGILRLFAIGQEDLLFGRYLWDSDKGRTLLAMVVLWCVLVVNGSIITFVLRPKLAGRTGSGVSAAQVQAHQQDQINAAQWVERLTRIDLGVALVVALLGSALQYGGLQALWQF